MKPEAQIIAIAEACGISIPVWAKKKQLTDWWNGPGYTNPVELPDYLKDLNAMHEAEKALISISKTMEFYEELIAVTTVDRFFLVHATAAQRAEAFLRTLGKWRDSSKE